MVEDTGIYSCVAKNSAGEDTTNCQVTVTKPVKKELKKKKEGQAPQFLRKLRQQTVNVGEELNLDVKLTGKPLPEVIW